MLSETASIHLASRALLVVAQHKQTVASKVAVDSVFIDTPPDASLVYGK
jgi:hypothetical protein